MLQITKQKIKNNIEGDDNDHDEDDNDDDSNYEVYDDDNINNLYFSKII